MNRKSDGKVVGELLIALTGTGDVVTIVDCLRKVESLPSSILTIFADMLDENPAVVRDWRLQIVPTDQRRKAMEEQKVEQIAHAVAAAYKEYPKLEAAVTHVETSTGVSRSTIFRDLQLSKASWLESDRIVSKLDLPAEEIRRIKRSSGRPDLPGFYEDERRR